MMSYVEEVRGMIEGGKGVRVREVGISVSIILIVNKRR
jgi:hypothetical protein